MYSWFKKKKGIDQGLYFMDTLDKDILQKLSDLGESNMMKSLTKMSFPKVKVDYKLYIDFSKPDELDEFNNLYTSETPQMVLDDLDMPFKVNIKKYNPDEKLKIRIISEKDWGHIDWKKGILKDPQSEPITLPAAIFFIHGGGFKSGSSGSYNGVLRDYSIKTGYPVF